MGSEQSRKRRRYSSELKAQILAECDVPGASVAKAAISHGINTNIVHGWPKLTRQVMRQLVLCSARSCRSRSHRRQRYGSMAGAIEVELRRGALIMKIAWPMSAAGDVAAWTRELLR